MIPQGLHQGGHPRLDGRKGQGLADHPGGADDHILGLYAAFCGQQAAHGLRNLHPVGVAGIGVAAVAQNGPGIPILHMGPGHGDGGALDQVGGIYAGRRRRPVAKDQGQVFFYLILANAAVYACGCESFCGANAAGYGFHRRNILIRSMDLHGFLQIQAFRFIQPQHDVHAL